jgi:DNA-binding CsgD family transcriptional regulator
VAPQPALRSTRVLITPATESEGAYSDRAQRHNRIAERYARGDLITDIAAAESVCVKTVRNVARRFGLPSRHPDHTATNHEIVERYAAGEPPMRIAERLGIARSHVWAIAKRAGLPPRKGWQRRYPLNEAAFDNPDGVGWWLIGLLGADGCIYEQEHRVSLCQRKHDIDVLRAFLEYVGSPGRPLIELRLSSEAAQRAWSRSDAFEARIFSSRICAALAVHGVVSQKSSALQFSEVAATQPAVWLGLLDGDGSIVRSHGRPRIDWYGARPAMEQCSRFWASQFEHDHLWAPSVCWHTPTLAKVSLYGSKAAQAAHIMLASTPVSHRRKRAKLFEIAQYVPGASANGTSKLKNGGQRCRT